MSLQPEGLRPFGQEGHELLTGDGFLLVQVLRQGVQGGAVFGQDVALIKRFAGDKMVYVGGKESLQRIYCSLLGDCARTLPRGASDNAVRDQLIRIYGMI